MKAWVLLRLLVQSSLMFLGECLARKVVDSMLLRAGNFGSKAWPLWAVKNKPSHTQTGFGSCSPDTQVCTSAVGQAAHCCWLTFSHLQTEFQSLYRCFLPYFWTLIQMMILQNGTFFPFYFSPFIAVVFKGLHWYWRTWCGVKWQRDGFAWFIVSNMWLTGSHMSSVCM